MPRTHYIVLLTLVGVAFALRVYRLSTPPLAWDEGWSIAISQLPWEEVAYLTAADVHPPAYYLILRPWLALGKGEFVLRFLSLLAGVLSVPLAYHAAWVWVGRQHTLAGQVGLVAAAYVALAPLLIYYSQVGRMYALCVAGVLLAVWGLLRCLDTQDPAPWSALLGWVGGALLAIYTFYYSALAIFGLVLYGLVVGRPLWQTTLGRRGLVRVFLATSAIALVYLPWLLYAIGPVTARVTARAETGGQSAEVGSLLLAGLYGMLYAYGLGWVVVWVLAAVVVGGVAMILKTRDWRLEILLLPVLAIGLTVLGVALGTQAHMFAARYTIGGSPFVGLAVAWGSVTLARRSRWLAVGVAVGVTVVTLGPTAIGHVYAKDLERSGVFEPWADGRALQTAGSRPDDLVVFNILSLAGAYDAYRRPTDPPWSYAQRWDPVTEAWERAETRLAQQAQHRPQVWTVLYRGTAGANAAIKEWLDRHMYPVSASWRQDTLTLLHLGLVEPRVEVEPQVRWAAGPVLLEAAYTTKTRVGGGVTVDLKWLSTRPLEKDYTIFVHVYDATNRLVAQHDGPPLGGSRPTSRWAPNRAIPDTHGLRIPTQAQGRLSLRVGLYDPVTGVRLLLDDGRDMAEIGTVTIE